MFKRLFGHYTTLRKIVIGILGLSVLLIGVLMIVLPGPAIIVIPAGLAILATEFAWARNILIRFKKKLGWTPERKQAGEAGARSDTKRRDSAPLSL